MIRQPRGGRRALCGGESLAAIACRTCTRRAGGTIAGDVVATSRTRVERIHGALRLQYELHCRTCRRTFWCLRAPK